MTQSQKSKADTVDAYSQNGAVTEPSTILPIKAANTVVMKSSNQIAFQLLYFQDP